MSKYLYRRVLLCLVIAGLTGCSSIRSPFDAATYSSNDSQTDQADTTDDVPYAIGKYLDQIRVARNIQPATQAVHEKTIAQ